MSNTIVACRRICCGRNPNTRRSLNRETSPNKISSSIFPEEEKISNNLSQSDRIINSDKNIQLPNEVIATPNHIYKIQSDVELDRLTKEYIETINEYRFHLGFSSLELSNELTNRALNRATELSRKNHIENSNRFDLIHNNEPIGETVMSCRSPVNHGQAIAKLIHDQLINDLKNGLLPKKRYAPILNQDCQSIGFGLVRNEAKTKDFIVIYYYPVTTSRELWQINENSITK